MHINKDNPVIRVIPGFSIAFCLALPSWYLGRLFPVVGSPILAIIIGMIIAAYVKLPNSYSHGIRFTSKKILQYAIVLLGFQMNLFNVVKLGGMSLVFIICVISAAIITALLFTKLFRLEKNIATLIAVGTAICGGSAIAATAPVIKADDREVASAISTIFLFNIMAVLLFPPLGRLLSMSDAGFGTWAGLAINDTSSVVAAAQTWSVDSLMQATIVKLTRTIMIIPITVLLGYHTSKNNKQETKVKIIKLLPWFVLGFLLASIITTLNLLSESTGGLLVSTGKFMIVIAMSAIGLNTDIKELFTSGIKPLALGLSCWIVVALVALGLQKMMGLW